MPGRLRPPRRLFVFALVALGLGGQQLRRHVPEPEQLQFRQLRIAVYRCRTVRAKSAARAGENLASLLFFPCTQRGASPVADGHFPCAQRALRPS